MLKKLVSGKILVLNGQFVLPTKRKMPMIKNSNSTKKILLTLHRMNPNIVHFFKEKLRLKEIKINPKTIDNAFLSLHQLSPKTLNFFQAYIPTSVKEYSFSNLTEELRLFIENDHHRHADAAQQFATLLTEVHAGDVQNTNEQLTTFDYIGQLQDPNLPFHDPNRQQKFWDQLLDAIKNAFRVDQTIALTRPQFKSVNAGNFSRFEVSFLEVVRFNAQTAVVCQLGGDSTPDGPSTTEFAIKASQGRAVHDNPSFGVAGFAQNHQDQWTVELRWTTYLRSLEYHDAFYMQAIYAFGTKLENDKFKALAQNVARILRTKFSNHTLPILGVTTAVVFKREPDGPYWTFVQLKEGGTSRIPESHLTPSSVHQPATMMKRSLPDEVSDIEFHIYRELIEEIFNYPENIHSDFALYRQLVEKHFVIAHLKQLIASNQACLHCHSLVLDMHRAKFELIYVLRIDDPAWFAAIGQHVHANQEAIKGGVVLAPLDAQGIHDALTGALTYSKPVRRMCSPGQAGLVAAIEHLKSRHDPHVENVAITSKELG